MCFNRCSYRFFGRFFSLLILIAERKCALLFRNIDLYYLGFSLNCFFLNRFFGYLLNGLFRDDLFQDNRFFWNCLTHPDILYFFIIKNRCGNSVYRNVFRCDDFSRLPALCFLSPLPTAASPKNSPLE